jgi:seryl-tRNA synthetase
MIYAELQLPSLKHYALQQNTLSKSVGAAKGDEKAALLENAKQLATDVKAADAKRAEAEDAANKIGMQIANLIDPAAPIGGEADFKVIEEIGKPRDFKAEGFEAKDHVELGKILKAIDTERGAKGFRRSLLLFNWSWRTS